MLFARKAFVRFVKIDCSCFWRGFFVGFGCFGIGACVWLREERLAWEF